MIKMDEIALYMGQGFQTTITQIPSTGYESARVTCILENHLNGKKAPP